MPNLGETREPKPAPPPSPPTTPELVSEWAMQTQMVAAIDEQIEALKRSKAKRQELLVAAAAEIAKRFENDHRDKFFQTNHGVVKFCKADFGGPLQLLKTIDARTPQP